MNKYSQAIIYKLTSPSTNKIYIGSTAQKISDRMAKHKYCYKKNKTYLTAFELLSYDDCEIEIIEHFPCNNRKELEHRE
ncbi:unnamed protein product, partial [Ectocarpus fasciculatus]